MEENNDTIDLCKSDSEVQAVFDVKDVNSTPPQASVIQPQIPPKLKRVQPTHISSNVGRPGIQDSITNNKPKVLDESQAPIVYTAENLAKLELLVAQMSKLLAEENEILYKFEAGEKHPEVKAAYEAIRKELAEEHRLSGKELEEKLESEMELWWQDQDTRLEQIAKDRTRLEMAISKLGVDPRDVCLKLEKKLEEENAEPTMPSQFGSLWTRNFDLQIYQTVHKQLNGEGIKSEYLPDYAAPGGKYQNPIIDGQGGQKLGGGASGFIQRSELLPSADIQQGGGGWPTTNARDTGFSNLSARYKIETPKQGPQFIKQLKKQRHGDALEAANEEDCEVEVVEHEDEDEDECYNCSEGGYLVLCDGCKRAYHPECVPVPDGHPPLTIDTLPAGDWFCPQCASKLPAGKHTPKRQKLSRLEMFKMKMKQRTQL